MAQKGEYQFAPGFEVRFSPDLRRERWNRPNPDQPFAGAIGIPQTSADVVRRVRTKWSNGAGSAFGRVLSTYGWRTCHDSSVGGAADDIAGADLRDGGKPAQRRALPI